MHFVRISMMKSAQVDALEGGHLISKLVPRTRTQPVRSGHLEVSSRLGAAMLLFPPQQVILPFKVDLRPLAYKRTGRSRW